MSDRAGWLERRRRGLGGSDVAAVLGLDPFRSPLDVYLDKRGLVAAGEESEAMRWGTLLEPAIAEEYARRADVILEALDPERLPLAHPSRPWQLGTPDRLICGQRRGLELKAPGYRQRERWGEPGTDAIPERYLVQVAWYLSLLDYEEWDVAALIGGQELRVYRVERNRALEDAILTRAGEFWRGHVVAGIPPAPTARDGATLARLWPRQRSEDVIRAGSELDVLGLRLAHVRDEQAALAEEREALEVAVKAAIGEHAGIEGAGWRATWRATRDGTRVEWERAVREGAIPQEVVARYTVARPGARRFLFRSESEGD